MILYKEMYVYSIVWALYIYFRLVLLLKAFWKAILELSKEMTGYELIINLMVILLDYLQRIVE